jgi:hypothetical protein
VLADWFEEQGERHWARWIRDTSQGAARKRLLKRLVRKAGWKMRETDHRCFALDEAWAGPRLSTLSWEVKTPSVLSDLLRCPAFARVDRVHLTSWRPRSAVPRVLPELVGRLPDLVHLDVLDVPCSLEPVRALGSLDGLGMRLDGAVHAELPVRALCIRALGPDDLAPWLEVQTDRLERLEIRRVRTDWDGSGLQATVVKALLDRPLRALAVDRALYHANRDVLERYSPGRIALLPPRPVWDPMLRREPPQRWSILAYLARIRGPRHRWTRSTRLLERSFPSAPCALVSSYGVANRSSARPRRTRPAAPVTRGLRATLRPAVGRGSHRDFLRKADEPGTCNTLLARESAVASPMRPGPLSGWPTPRCAVHGAPPGSP